MAIFLGNTLLTGGSSGGGGAAIPETAIFNSSDVWAVPQSVQDEITAEGHSEIGLLLVGGGSVSSAGSSGEIINELIQLTGADYDPIALQVTATAAVGATTLSIQAAPKDLVGAIFLNGTTTISITAGAAGATSVTLSTALTNEITAGELRVTHTTQSNPVVTVAIGAPGGNTGFTQHVDTEIVNGNPTSAPNAIDGSAVYTVPPNMALDSDGWPLIQSFSGTLSLFTGSPTQSGFTVMPTITHTLGSTLSITWPSPTAFDGVVSQVGEVFGDSGTFTLRWDGSTPEERMSLRRFRATWSNTSRDLNFGPLSFTYQATDMHITEARHGDSGETAMFLNNAGSSEGYFGGYGRSGSSRPNTGSPGQTGYVQIFYT